MNDRLDISNLSAIFTGPLLRPEDEGFDEARKVWNNMIDHHPAIIARCQSVNDVAAAVQFATSNNLEISVRCGGHNIAGYAVTDGGLMIDLSLMNKVEVDPETRRATVQGGALLGSLDRESQKYGLATTAGNVSHTGVGGLTLAGGTGWLARLFGLACDNVLSFELVTAAGDILRVTETEYPDLFWGLKGGGGNFGIVTEFEFQLHPIRGQAIVADLYYPMEAAQEAIAHWRSLIKDSPREATLTAWVGTSGEWPFLPSEYHGKPIAKINYVWVGEPEDGRAYLPVLKGETKPVAENVTSMSYVELQSSEDSTIQERGARRYWKGHYLNELSDEALGAFLARGASFDSREDIGSLPNGSLIVYGGAIADISDEATAYSHRDACVEFLASTKWTEPSEDEPRIATVRRYGHAVGSYASGTYINSVSKEDHGAKGAFPPATFEKLARLKREYDPHNVFHLNQNISPAAS